MEQPGYLIDTNAVSDYLSNSLSNAANVLVQHALDDGMKISVISKIELLTYRNRSLREMNAVKAIVDVAEVIDLTDDIVTETINVRSDKKMDVPDAIIAATALIHHLKLVTRNVRDFYGVKNLSVIDTAEVNEP